MAKNFAILRVGKIKSAVSVKGMLKHNFRDIETPNADSSITDKNIHLAALSVDDGMQRYKDILPDKVRKNAVHAIDYLVTTSPGATPEANAGAIREALSWVSERHGKENIIMASVHNDESTPHVHILAMPMKDGKLNARHFIGGTKDRLSELQDEFYERIEKQGLDLKRGLKGSKAKHKDIQNHYAEVNLVLNHRDRLENNGAIKAGKMLKKGMETLPNLAAAAKVQVFEKIADRLITQGLNKPAPLKAQDKGQDFER